MMISRIHFPVRALGWGTRVGIWVQGCSIQCVGCMSKDTWSIDTSTEVSITEIARVISECLPVDGVTISGGEPLDQADELESLLHVLRQILDSRGQGDILCYSGRSDTVVKARFQRILALVDAMVVGPYQYRNQVEHPLKGSSNQKVLAVTPLGVSRYLDNEDELCTQRMQIHIDGSRIRTIGVPGAQDLNEIDRIAASSGLRIAASSWGDD